MAGGRYKGRDTVVGDFRSIKAEGPDSQAATRLFLRQLSPSADEVAAAGDGRHGGRAGFAARAGKGCSSMSWAMANSASRKVLSTKPGSSTAKGSVELNAGPLVHANSSIYASGQWV
jgi:hypothetical protein